MGAMLLPILDSTVTALANPPFMGNSLSRRLRGNDLISSLASLAYLQEDSAVRPDARH